MDELKKNLWRFILQNYEYPIVDLKLDFQD